MRFPIEEYLTPIQKPGVDEEFTLIEEKLQHGLPHQIRLDSGINLIVVIPSGTANRWRNTDPKTLLCSSYNERQPQLDSETFYESSFERVPARILVRQQRAIRGVLPLCSGLQRTIDTTGNGTGMLLELKIISWNIHIGIMRDRSDYGSTLKLAWRRVDQAVEKYSTPPVNPYILPRLKQPLFKMLSTLGIREPRVMTRFTARQKFIKARKNG